MKSVLNDLRHALRVTGKTRFLSAVAIVTIGIGIGANTGVFSLLDASLFQPPFKQPNTLVGIFNRFPTLDSGPVSLPDFLEWRTQNGTFERMAAYTVNRVSLAAGGSEPRRIFGSFVSDGYFGVLKASARMGRLFAREDHAEGAAPVCVISTSFWRRQFGGRDDVLTRTVTVNGVAYNVVGVAEADVPSFSYPEKTEVWVPLEPRAPFKVRGTNYLDVIGRMKPDVPITRARADIETIQARINADFPDNAHTVTLRPLVQVVFGDTKPVLVLLLWAAGGVILIACANLANLLLVRGSSRMKEFALRQALGAARGRIVRQLLAEGLVIAIIGGIAGVLVGAAFDRLLIAFAPSGVRMPDTVGLDWRIVAFSLGLIFTVAIASGILPALRASRTELSEALRVNTTQTTATARNRGVRQRFVVAEIALATVLLAGALVTLKSLWMLVHIDPGFRPDHLLTLQISLAGPRYSVESRSAQFFSQLLERIRILPGVVTAGAISNLPIGEGGTTGDFLIEGRPKPAPGSELFAEKEIVTPGYFEAMKIPLVAGRFFSESDRAASQKVVVINQQMAKTYWPGESPIGRRLDLGFGNENDWQTIVGVVGNVKTEDLGTPPTIGAYLSAAQYPASAMTVVMRTSIDPASLVTAAKSSVSALDSQQAVSATVMDQVLWRSVSRPRSVAYLLGAFAGIALILAAIGIYGVVAYSVIERTQEIGVRMAIGADRADVLRSVLRSGLKLTAAGVGIGLCVSIILMLVLRNLLFGIGATDPAAFAGVILILGLVTILASYVPARRAATIDPIMALRNE
jgi:putative ABC transport system permease protein